MAERRMVHRKVSVSADLAALDAKFGPRAPLFYTWLIPQLDRWGCAPADPATLLGMVGPLWRDTTPQDVSKWIKWMVDRGMLERVTGRDGERGIRVPRFHKHQAGTQWEREGQSPYEPEDVTKKWTRGRAKKSAPTRAGLRPVSDQSATGLSEGKGREVRPSPSPTPPPAGRRRAATSPEPEPEATQATSPEPSPRTTPTDADTPTRVDLAAIARATGSRTLANAAAAAAATRRTT